MDTIKREEQKKEFTWDLELVYKNIKEYEKDYNKVTKLIDKLKKYEGKILDSPKNLLECFDIDTEIGLIFENLMTYAYRKYHEDISNSTYQELIGKFNNLQDLYSSSSAYITPELLKSDYSKIEQFIKEQEKLKKYELMLSRIFRYKEHILSKNEEMILSELSSSLNTVDRVAGIIRDSELQFGTIKDSEGKDVKVDSEHFSIFLEDKDRRVRHDAFMSLYDSYSKYKDTLSECINGFVSANCKIAKLKNYKNAKEYSLFDSRVDPKIYDNLIETVNERLDVLHKYYALRNKVLKLDKQNIYDTYINLSDSVQKKYSYEEAKEINKDALKVLGDDYLNKINELYNNRYIDVYPNQNKRGGAYSAGGYETAPYILLNYLDTFYDVSTLIHESGHSVHTMYSNENNSYLYHGYKIFVAEVASTVNELLLHYYMLENTEDKEEKKYYISEMMNMIKATLFRQTMFSEFEDFMYTEYEKGNVLTSKLLCDKYLELNKKYFGDNVNVNEEIKYEWLRIPHFYYYFYVYQYATGISSACYIVDRIRKGEKGAVNDYLNFLKSGDSLDPVDELKLAGVDISDKDVINSAIDMFDSLIDEYDKLI